MRIPVTRKPWFTAKRYGGYGWSPCSWEGWAVTGLSIAVIVGLSTAFPHRAWIPLVIVLPSLIVVIYLTRRTRSDIDQGQANHTDLS